MLLLLIVIMGNEGLAKLCGSSEGGGSELNAAIERESDASILNSNASCRRRFHFDLDEEQWDVGVGDDEEADDEAVDIIVDDDLLPPLILRR